LRQFLAVRGCPFKNDNRLNGILNHKLAVVCWISVCDSSRSFQLAVEPVFWLYFDANPRTGVRAAFTVQFAPVRGGVDLIVSQAIY
jgi:hypothetical protein